MKRILLATVLLIVAAYTLALPTVMLPESLLTQYDTKQAFLAGTDDYAVSESFTGLPVGNKYLIITTITPDSTVNTAATAGKYLVPRIQGSNDNSTWLNITESYLWLKLCEVAATTGSGNNNKGSSSTWVANMTGVNCAYYRIRYDVYAAGTRLTDVTTAGYVKTIITVYNIK